MRPFFVNRTLPRPVLIVTEVIIAATLISGIAWYFVEEGRENNRRIERCIRAEASEILQLAEAAPNRQEFLRHSKNVTAFHIVSQNEKTIVFEVLNTNSVYGRYTIIVSFPNHQTQ
jgi:hypothetical protein